MDLKQLHGSWFSLRKKIKAKWHLLEEDELEQFTGNYEQLANVIQVKYGFSREEAESELNDFILENNRRALHR